MRIKILQWNVLYKEDPRRIAEFIKSIQPDIACLQELSIGAVANPSIRDTSAYIATETGMQPYFEIAHDYSGRQNAELEAIGNGIFANFPIIRKDHFFTRYPSINPQTHSESGRVYIETDIAIGNRILTIATTHLSFIPRFEMSDTKIEEVDRLVDFLKKKKTNYVLTGDFNATPDSYAVTEISKHLKHCGPSFKEPTWTTKPFDYKGFKEDKLVWRIDYAFATKDISVISSEILKTDVSDHLPILLTIDLD